MIRLSAELLKRLKIAAAFSGKTMREIAEAAIAKQLDEDERALSELLRPQRGAGVSKRRKAP